MALEIDLGQPGGHLRRAPVHLQPQSERGLIVAHAADFDVDPWEEMFFYPTIGYNLVDLTGC
jgi:hypothetical protein